ncbi:MAG: hypothetical protein L7S70_11075, partial [Pseudomonadales bacterium]|nr:hypothetical protein [Pseudomonadales bacterium]
MTRLLIAGLLLSVSSFGWASVYPDKYEGVPNTFKDGDIIKAEEFNNNNLSITKAINGVLTSTTVEAIALISTGGGGISLT